MKLKATTLSGPALFSATPVVWVSVQFTQDNWAGSNEDRSQTLEVQFHEFMRHERLYPAIQSGHSGGGSYAYAFTPEDAAKIQAWLLEHGCISESD
jgi:hypothetical protein